MESHPCQHHVAKLILQLYQYWSMGKFNSKLNPNQLSFIWHMDLWYNQASFLFRFCVRQRWFLVLLFTIFFKQVNSLVKFDSIVFHIQSSFFWVRLILYLELVLIIIRLNFFCEFLLFLYGHFHSNDLKNLDEDSYLLSLENINF